MTIDTEELRSRLPELRWFGDKDRAVAGVDVVDDATAQEGPPRLVFALLRVRFADGASRLYSAPLLVSDGRAVDAFEDPERLRVLGDLMAHGTTLKAARGSFHFGGPGLDPLAPPGGRSLTVIGSEQSNTSLVLDDEVIVKLFRRIEVGSNPDLEINRLLTNEGFEFVPPHVGEIVYELDEETSIDLGIAQRYVHGATDGWTETLRHVHTLFDEVHPEDLAEDRRRLTEERSAPILERIEQLGDVTAAMHVLLSREEIDPDFAPEPLDPSDVKEATEGMRRDLSDLTATGVAELEPLRARIERMIDAVSALGDDLGMRTRIHGDFHLGQVLMTEREWFIIDFEGEPARPLADRRLKQPPLRDVSGMLRSFNYAALVPLFERTEGDPDERDRLRPWAECWEALARERFLTGYLRTAHEGRYLPADRDVLDRAQDLFELEKALYEVGYEQANRPHWIDIPLVGVRRLIEGKGSK